MDCHRAPHCLAELLAGLWQKGQLWPAGTAELPSPPMNLQDSETMAQRFAISQYMNFQFPRLPGLPPQADISHCKTKHFLLRPLITDEPVYGTKPSAAGENAGHGIR